MGSDARELYDQLSAIYGEPKIWEPFDRLRAVIMDENGTDIGSIAKTLHRTRATVEKWLEDFKRGGLQQLFPIKEEERAAQRSQQLFSNLIIAKLAEDLYEDLLGAKLREHGLQSIDRRAEQSEIDFELQRDEQTVLLVNVKIHSSMFREAHKFVGLQPSNTFPLALYKILMGFKRQQQYNAPFVFLISIYWDIVQKVIPQALDEGDIRLIRTVFETGGAGSRRAEDILVQSLINKMRKASSWKRLLDDLRINGTHVLLSARRALDLFMSNFEKRCPAITLRGFGSRFAGTRGVAAEVNMHFAISQELTPISQALSKLNTGGLQSFLDEIKKGRI